MKNEILKNSLFILVFLSISFFFAKFNLPVGRTFEKDYKLKFIIEPKKEFNFNQSSVVYIWATWCSVCKANKIPIEWNFKISQVLGVNFISLEEGENLDELKDYLNQNTVTYPVGLLDPALSDEMDIKEYPSLVYINNNRILLKDTGMVNPISFLLRLFYLKLFFDL